MAFSGGPTDLKPKRVFVGKALAVLALAIWFSFIALFEHYSATRPKRADVASGRIYQLNNHGSYAYLTKGEQQRLWWLEFGGIPFVLAAMVVTRFDRELKISQSLLSLRAAEDRHRELHDL
jgi:hypothetical protein